MFVAYDRTEPENKTIIKVQVSAELQRVLFLATVEQLIREGVLPRETCIVTGSTEQIALVMPSFPNPDAGFELLKSELLLRQGWELRRGGLSHDEYVQVLNDAQGW